MKMTHYDVLEVSAKASPEVIDAAYGKLKSQLTSAAQNGDGEARNRLMFLQEAYATLCSPEKRAAYDASLLQAKPMPKTDQPMAYASDSSFLSGWAGSTMVKIVIGVGAVAAVYSAYQSIGQRGNRNIQAKQIEVQAKPVEIQSAVAVGRVQNDTASRVEGDRVQNQDKLIEKSYDVASREADRRDAELELRADIASQRLEMERQRLEMEKQRQQWAQEKYEKDRVRIEAQQVHLRNKQQLCNLYISNGQPAMARQEGCYSLTKVAP